MADEKIAWVNAKRTASHFGLNKNEIEGVLWTLGFLDLFPSNWQRLLLALTSNRSNISLPAEASFTHLAKTASQRVRLYTFPSLIVLP